MAESGFRLGIDFGTSNTVAVLRWPDGRTKALLFDGAPIMPSAVYTAEDGTILTGRDAVHSARLQPHRFEPYPKRRIDEQTVYLGDREIPSTELIATVLRRVALEAGRVANAVPTHVTLTHPAAWGAQRRDALSRAALAAGLPQPLLVPEPVAAASYFVGTIGAHLPIGGCAVVYDFGAGTFDATVVRRTAAGGFDVLSTEGLTDAGGLDVDAAIVSYLGQQLAERAPNEWRRLSQPSDDTDRRAAWQLWEDARQAKETLSRAATTYVHVPLVDDSVPLGREQLEQLARPILDRTVTATLLSVAAAGLTPPQLAAVFLVGGSSRIPLTATLLHRGFGTAPMAIEQPELVVAEGALQLAPRSGRAVVGPPGVGGPGQPSPGPGGAPGPGMGGPGPVSPATAGPRPASPGPGGYSVPGGSGGPGPGQAPGAYPERPVSATPMSAAPMSGPPVSGAPMSGTPMSGPPSSGGPGAPVSGSGGAPGAGAPVSGPPVFGTPPQQPAGPFPPQSSAPPSQQGQAPTFTMPSSGPASGPPAGASSGAGFGGPPQPGAAYGTPQQSASSTFGGPPHGAYAAPTGQPVSGAGPMPTSGSWPPVQAGPQGPMTGPQPPMTGPPHGPMGPQVAGAPMSGPPGPVSGQPMSGQPMSGQPMSGQPMSGQPMSGPPMGGAHGVPLGSFGPHPGAPRRSRGPLVAAIAAGAVVLLLVVGGIAYGLTRSGPKKPTPEPVAAAACGYKIAYLGVLSGDNSGDGQTVRNAAKLALDKYNSTHSGCTAELAEYDTKGDEDEAARMASDLVRDEKIVGVVGPIWYSEAEKVMPIFDAAGLPVISPALMYSDLSTKGWKTFHRTIGTDTDQASAAAKYLTETLKAQRVFIVSDKDEYAAVAANEARTRLNTKFVGRADIAGDEKTFASVVSQVTASTADAVYFTGYHDAGGIFVKEMRAAKPGIKIVGWDRIFTDLFVETATAASAEGVAITCPCVPPSEARENFANDFRAKYSEAGYYGPEAFDAANVLLAALNAGKATRADVNAFIGSYDGQGVSRQIKFGANGDLDATTPTVWAYTVKDGSIYKDRVIT